MAITNGGGGFSIGDWSARASSVYNPYPNTGKGTITAQEWALDVVPVTKSTTIVAALQHTTNGTALTLAAAATGWASVTINVPTATAAFQFDTPRAVTLTSSANMSANNFTIVGYDIDLRKVTQVIAGPNANTVTTTKTWAFIVSITPSVTDGTNSVSVGTADIFGLPYRIDHGNYLTTRFGVATGVALDAGTFVAADTTNPATTATGDTRGTYAPSAASNSAKRLTVYGTFTQTQLDAGTGVTTQYPSAVFGIAPV